MSKERIREIEYIRGISMLGVIGIHTGGYTLSNPAVNIHLFALLEIFTRFSVPIFFFISAFCLFINQDLTAKFDYSRFMLRRFRTVLIPYLAWSGIYMLHYTLVSGNTLPWHFPLIFKYLLFGLASYQLYFLVILMWFYLLMPLWRLLVRYIVRNSLRNLFLLLLLQIAFNYYSSYILHANFSNPYLNVLIQERMSYWVLHYIFIFLLGAVCAVNYPQFKEMIDHYKRCIAGFFGLTLTGILFYYYHLLYINHFTPEQAVNTAHQLSPIGVLYTLGATLFWFMFFSRIPFSHGISDILSRLGEYSYAAYLVHPLIMYYAINYIMGHGLMMTAAVTILFYILIVSTSLTFAMLLQKASNFFPATGFLLTGSTTRKAKSGM